MAVKIITIDLEAYGLLLQHQRAGQSFSAVIKARLSAKPTAGRLLKRLRSIRVSVQALDEMERQVQARKREPARAVTRCSTSIVRSSSTC